mmetsp:Transcript_11367/g.15738  ORF Transcript_11367/g.15738 Transcript_11367/m.15738 type:complete len:212 (+) Transcript_11367:406-1041(+)
MPSILTRPSPAKLLQRVPYLSQTKNRLSSPFRFNHFLKEKQKMTSSVVKKSSPSFRDGIEASIRKEIQTSLQGMQFQLDLTTEKEIEETERIILTFCKTEKLEAQNVSIGKSKKVCASTEIKLPTAVISKFRETFDGGPQNLTCGEGFRDSFTGEFASQTQPNKRDFFGMAENDCTDTHRGGGWNEQWFLDMCQRFASEDIREAVSVVTVS